MVSKPYVATAFGLDAQINKRAIRDKVEHLLDDAHFIFKARFRFSLCFIIFNTKHVRTRSVKLGCFLPL